MTKRYCVANKNIHVLAKKVSCWPQCSDYDIIVSDLMKFYSAILSMNKKHSFKTDELPALL